MKDKIIKVINDLKTFFLKKTEKKDRNSILALDGLRGIAVLYVLFGHLGNVKLYLIPGLKHHGLGKVGVWIFFGLSAYLLTYRLTRELSLYQDRIKRITAYCINRVFRIYPLFIVVLFVHLYLDDITFNSFINHLLLKEGRGELWAIPVEFKYYVVIPFIAMSYALLGFRKSLMLFLAGSAAALFLNYKSSQFAFNNVVDLIPRLAPFLAGSFVALLTVGKSRTELKPHHWTVLILFPVILSICTYFYHTGGVAVIVKKPNVFIFSSALSIAVALGISLCLRKNVISSFFELTPLVFAGRVSFSIYLWHMFIIKYLFHLHFHPTIRAWIITFMVLFISYLSYKYIETPGIKFGQRLAKKISGNKTNS